jgi:hypothetical protein
LILGAVFQITQSYLQVKNNNFATIRLGDFPPFYTAAAMLKKGLGNRLYDFNLQSEIQSRTCAVKHQFLPFIYPPYVAFFLTPFAQFSAENAKTVMVCSMLVFLILAISLAARVAPVLKQNILATTAFFLCFTPVLTGVLGGQNTALSMFFYAGILWSFSRQTRSGDWVCGIFLGLWIFKPQYALPVIVLFAFSKSWRIVAGAAAIGIVYYLIGSAISGFAWPLEWFDKARYFDKQYLLTNASRMISILRVLKTGNFLIPSGLPKERLTDVLGYGISLTIFSWLAAKFFFAGNLSENSKKRQKLRELLELAEPAVLLISPCSFFYDFGICILSCARHVKLQTDRQISIFIALALAGSMAAGYRDSFPVQPLFFAVVGIFFYLIRCFKRENACHSGAR